jgi:hypothetical protein
MKTDHVCRPKPKSAFDAMVTPDWPTIWAKIGTQVGHKVECDDAESFMRVIASRDGDMHLVLDHGRNQCGMTPTFRARTFQGGGRNDRVRLALAMLALAIVEDCETNMPGERTRPAGDNP